MARKCVAIRACEVVPILSAWRPSKILGCPGTARSTWARPLRCTAVVDTFMRNNSKRPPMTAV
jgi:hypothetical protein